jgi:IS30 family transposase
MHLTRDERVKIETRLENGESLRAIAARLERSPSTLSRELRRNGFAGDPYCVDAARKRVTGRARGRPRLRLRGPSLAEPRGSALYRYALRGDCASGGAR